MAALLGQIGRREVHHQSLGGQGKAQAGKGGANAFPALSDRLIAEAHDNEGDHARTRLDFDVDPAGLHSFKCGCHNPRGQASISTPFCGLGPMQTRKTT